MKLRNVLLFGLIFWTATVAARGMEEHKYAVAVYHWNLQYLAGDTEMENRIITQSLEPMCDLFLRHPDWGGNFEMQGYMLEQAAQRFPAIFEKLKTLINRGQIDLVSFHYSDQLFLAYGAKDMEWSEKLNQAVFQRLGIKRSPVVFAQEGQYGEGMADFMSKNGYKLLVLPGNLYRYFHKDDEPKPMPYYKVNGMNVIRSRGVDWQNGTDRIILDWTFLNDAELLPTGNKSPYFSDYAYLPEALAKYEKRLEESQARGFRIANLSQYIDDVLALGVEPAALPPVLDGVWQPKDTENIFRWMGMYLAVYERDNEILCANMRTRNQLLAAETVISHLKANGRDTAELDKIFDNSIRELMLAEVSDSTGWTPAEIEIKYSQTHNAEALKGAGEILDKALELLGAKYLAIDTQSGEAAPLESLEANENLEPADCPVDMKLTGQFSSSSIKCYQWDNGVKAVADFKTINWYSNTVNLLFGPTTDKVEYTPALLDRAVSYPFSQFNPEKEKIYIPAADGLIGLGGGWYLVQDTQTVHLAPEIDMSSGHVSLKMIKPPNADFHWEFYLVKTDLESAHNLARRTNLYPLIFYK